MGDNTLVSKNDGDIIPSSVVNQYRTALNGDLVPRNTSGVATDLAGDIGTSSIGWANVYADTYNIGTPASGLKIVENGSNQISIQSSGVERVIIDDDGLNADGLKDATISAAKLGVNSVTTTKISDSNVTTAKIADSNVTRAKIEDVGEQSSSSSGSFSTTSASAVDVTNLSVTITTSGRPIMIFLTPTSSGGSLYAQGTAGVVDILRGATNVGSFRLSADTRVPPGCVMVINAPSAGTYTFKAQAYSVGGSPNIMNVINCTLNAYEL